MSPRLKGVIRNGRVEMDTPIDLPEGIEVVVAPTEDDGPMSPEEIARVLDGMQRLQPLDIPDAVAAELEEWEQALNRRGIDRAEAGIEDVFR